MSGDVVRDLVNQEDLRRAERAQRRYKRALAAGVALAATLVVVAGAVMIVLLLQTRELASDVESCIVPRGDCYERSAQRYREASEDRDRILEVLCDVQPSSPECLLQP